MTKQEVTVTAPRAERPLQALPAVEFTNCLREVGVDADGRNLTPGVGLPPAFYLQERMCEHQLNGEKRIVIKACSNRSGNTAPPRVIQACTELLDRKIFEGNERFMVDELEEEHCTVSTDRQIADLIDDQQGESVFRNRQRLLRTCRCAGDDVSAGLP